MIKFSKSPDNFFTNDTKLLISRFIEDKNKPKIQKISREKLTKLFKKHGVKTISNLLQDNLKILPNTIDEKGSLKFIKLGNLLTFFNQNNQNDFSKDKHFQLARKHDKFENFPSGADTFWGTAELSHINRIRDSKLISKIFEKIDYSGLAHPDDLGFEGIENFKNTYKRFSNILSELQEENKNINVASDKQIKKDLEPYMMTFDYLNDHSQAAIQANKALKQGLYYAIDLHKQKVITYDELKDHGFNIMADLIRNKVFTKEVIKELESGYNRFDPDSNPSNKPEKVSNKSLSKLEEKFNQFKDEMTAQFNKFKLKFS
jgi:hypothetical protein